VTKRGRLAYVLLLALLPGCESMFGLSRDVEHSVDDLATFSMPKQWRRYGDAVREPTYALFEFQRTQRRWVIDALLRGTLERDGDVACNYASMLLFLHGLAESPDDWELRPFWLRFNTEDRVEREAVFRELCERMQLDASRYIATG
jgi:hypothetical protein